MFTRRGGGGEGGRGGDTDFKFSTFIGRFQSDGASVTAVKGFMITKGYTNLYCSARIAQFLGDPFPNAFRRKVVLFEESLQLVSVVA